MDSPFKICRRYRVLGADGLRTVAGTERIGDVELGTIIDLSAFQGLTDVDEFDSVVVPDKTHIVFSLVIQARYVLLRQA